MTEPLAAQLLKDLRGLGKPPSFDGNDTDYQEFRFSLRTHVSLASMVSHMLMDKCEAERTPITLESAGGRTLEVLHACVLLVGFDHERKCPNPCPIC